MYLGASLEGTLLLQKYWLEQSQNLHLNAFLSTLKLILMSCSGYFIAAITQYQGNVNSSRKH